MTCPKCGAEAPAGALECPACGVVFSKLAPRGAGPLPPPPPPRRLEPRLEPPLEPPPPDLPPDFVPRAVEIDRVEDGRFGPAERRLVYWGVGGAIVVWAIPPLRFLVRYFAILIHELGHAVTAWLLGHPAIPAFDFVYGGGLTSHSEFHVFLAVFIAVLWGLLGWRVRGNRWTLGIVGAGFLVWLFLVWTDTRRMVVFAAAGHLSEVVFAGIFLYMSLAGVGWRSPELERPFGMFVAAFLQLNAMAFALRLVTDRAFLAEYRIGKGGALMNDLEKVALEVQIWTGLHPGIRGVAEIYLILSPIPVVVAILAFRYRARVHGWISWLLTEQG